MTDFDPALIEQAAQAIFDTYGQRDTDRSRRLARAVLEAVADDLRADAWDEGYQAAADDWCAPGVFGRVSRNPYRRSDQ